MYYSYVCFVLCARALGQREFEILSAQSRRIENPRTTANNRILYQRSANQQTITALRDHWKFQQEPRNARRNGNQQSSNNNNAYTRSAKNA